MLSTDLLMMLAFPILLVVAGLASHWSRERRLTAWKGLAERYGFTSGPPPLGGLPVLVGSVHGHDVEVRVIRRGSGKSKASYTVVRTHLSIPVPAGLKVKRDHVVGKLLTAMGDQDIPLADPRLDTQLKVQGHSAQAVQDLLDIGVVRPAMQRFFALGPYARLEGTEVIADRRGVQTGAEFDEMLAAATGLVTAMSEGRARAWNDLAKRHGLERSGDRSIRLAGEREGVAVCIESTGSQTQLTVDIRDVDPRVRIRAGGGGFVEGDQILGNRVCITGDASTLPAQFGPGQLDALRGDLMQVFETWPDTELREGRLEGTLPGEPFRTLDAMLGDYRSLADALRTAAAIR